MNVCIICMHYEYMLSECMHYECKHYQCKLYECMHYECKHYQCMLYEFHSLHEGVCACVLVFMLLSNLGLLILLPFGPESLPGQCQMVPLVVLLLLVAD